MKKNSEEVTIDTAGVDPVDGHDDDGEDEREEPGHHVEVGGLGLYQILHLRQEDKVRTPKKRSGAVLSSRYPK